MSDFLSNLISRSFAAEPTIRPRLPSLFESVAAETVSEVQPVAPMPTTAPAPPPPTPPLPNSSSPEKPAAEHPMAHASVGSPDEPEASFKNEPATSRPSSITPLPPSNNSRVIEPEPKKVVVPTTSAFDQRNSGHTARSLLFQEISERPAFKATRQSVFSPVEPRLPAPAIHVTIGRVEVRAIQSAAPAPILAKPAPPKLSLDDYLQKRDGGAR